MEKKTINTYCLLTVGKTQESKEQAEFSRYIGVASSYVLAVNPDKQTLDKLMGYESANAPEYVVDGDNGKEVRIHFIVKTDAEANNGIEITNRLMFTLRNAPAYNRDETKVQVIDRFGNTTWAPVEDAKEGKALRAGNGNPLKVDSKYRMACVGEADLVTFLKKYLCVQDAFTYQNGTWMLKPNPEEYVFGLEHIKDYFKGDFSELRDALKLQPNNKVKLLYGVRTAETENGTRQYQAVCSRGEFILPNNANEKALLKLAKDLGNAKAAGSYATTEFKVQPLEEYKVEATDLSAPKQEEPEDMPWD